MDRHFAYQRSPDAVEALSRRLLEPLRAVARQHGYALATHGSMRRDIDLIAVPWRDRASDPALLAMDLMFAVEKIVGRETRVIVSPEQGKPKPHGRICWSFWIGQWTYIDLSILPRAPHGA